jgi:mRNA interferase MazF
MKRGEIWTVSGSDYAGKPRPAVIVQDDRFDATDFITVCPFTGEQVDLPLFRPVVEPSEHNHLKIKSRLMADKIMTVPRSKIGQRIGILTDADMVRLNQAMLLFLGIAASVGKNR